MKECNWVNWALYIDIESGLYYLQNPENEWWEWDDKYDEWVAVVRDTNEGLDRVKELVEDETYQYWTIYEI